MTQSSIVDHITGVLHRPLDHIGVWVALVVGAFAWNFLFPYFVTYSGLSDVPGPALAKFTNLWLFRTVRAGHRSETVHKLHNELGPLVRLAPNHVSVANDAAIKTIYGHGNGFLKTDFYDAFVSIRRGLFNTRDRNEHTRKRKMVSHTFSAKNIREFEPYMQDNLHLFVKQWDSLIEQAGGEAKLECLDWMNYLAFDMIGDLAFGAPFGMLKAQADRAELRESPDAPPTYANAVEILNRRGEISATLGSMPALIPYAQYIPDEFFSKGVEAVKNLAKIAIASVKNRVDNPPADARNDLLARLQEGKDDQGNPIGREELTAEALTQLIAGSDTTSNSSCALLFYVTKTPGVLAKLQAELDEAMPEDMEVPTYDMIKDLPYLESIFFETLRYHSTSGMGLPRMIPDDSPGVTILGHYFGPGTVLSVPTYSIHRSLEIWGPDANEFKPERWAKATQRQKDAFVPFSHGPRSCVGRNVAEMEMKLIIATWAHRYAPRLLQDKLETAEGFLRKPLGLDITIQRRH